MFSFSPRFCSPSFTDSFDNRQRFFLPSGAPSVGSFDDSVSFFYLSLVFLPPCAKTPCHLPFASSLFLFRPSPFLLCRSRPAFSYSMGNTSSAPEQSLVEKVRTQEAQLLTASRARVEKVSKSLHAAMRKRYQSTPLEGLRQELSSLFRVNLDAYDRWINLAALLLAIWEADPDSAAKIQQIAPDFPYESTSSNSSNSGDEVHGDDDDDDDELLTKKELSKTLGDLRASILADIKTLMRPTLQQESLMAPASAAAPPHHSSPPEPSPQALAPPSPPLILTPPQVPKHSSSFSPLGSSLHQESSTHLRTPEITQPNFYRTAPNLMTSMPSFSIRQDSWRQRGILGMVLTTPNGPNLVLDYLVAEINKTLSSDLLKLSLLAHIDTIYAILARIQPMVFSDPDSLPAAASLIDASFEPCQRAAESLTFYLTSASKYAPSYAHEYYKLLEGHTGDFTPSEMSSKRRSVKSWVPLKQASQDFRQFRDRPFRPKGDSHRPSSPHHRTRSRSRSSSGSRSSKSTQSRSSKGSQKP